MRLRRCSLRSQIVDVCSTHWTLYRSLFEMFTWDIHLQKFIIIQLYSWLVHRLAAMCGHDGQIAYAADGRMVGRMLLSTSYIATVTVSSW